MATLSNNQVALLFDEAAAEYEERSNPYTMARRVEALASLAAGRCVEFGGGTGVVTSRLRDRSQAIHSDISSNMCRVARAKLGCPSICFDAEAIPLAGDSVDTAISAEMVYYLDHPERFITEAHRVLRPGGRLLISTTNPAATLLERGRTLLRRLGFSRMFFDDGSPKFISMRRLTAMLERAGFTVEQTRKIIVLPFAFLDPVNRWLERTVLRHFGLFMIIVARKR